MLEYPHMYFYRGTRNVACFLLHSCKQIEQGTFTAIGVTGEDQGSFLQHLSTSICSASDKRIASFVSFTLMIMGSRMGVWCSMVMYSPGMQPKSKRRSFNFSSLKDIIIALAPKESSLSFTWCKLTANLSKSVNEFGNLSLP